MEILSYSYICHYIFGYIFECMLNADHIYLVPAYSDNCRSIEVAEYRQGLRQADGRLLANSRTPTGRPTQ